METAAAIQKGPSLVGGIQASTTRDLKFIQKSNEMEHEMSNSSLSVAQQSIQE